MDYRENEAENEDFFLDVRKTRKKAKEDILDETFEKAEISKGLRPKKEEKGTKKPFLKLGIILIFIAVISLVIVINHLPWMFIKYDAEYGTIQEFYHRDFINEEDHYYEEIDDIFESPCTNCSNSSKNYIGLIKDDFTNIPKTTSYGFITLALLGIIFTIFGIFERIRNFSRELVTVIHSTFAAAAFIVSIIIALSTIKFLGSHFLLYYNKPFIEASGVNDVILIYPVPLILIVISFAIMIIASTVMKINFHEFEKKLVPEKKRSSVSNFKFGNKI